MNTWQCENKIEWNFTWDVQSPFYTFCKKEITFGLLFSLNRHFYVISSPFNAISSRFNVVTSTQCHWEVASTVEYLALPEAVVAEWLRRLTRNQIPSGSVGSNPTDCEYFFFFSLISWFVRLGQTRDRSDPNKHRWFSGRMAACHAVGPGSIPGRCNPTFYLFMRSNKKEGDEKENIFGGAGYRSRYLSHAKRALYHLSYAPGWRSLDWNLIQS